MTSATWLNLSRQLCIFLAPSDRDTCQRTTSSMAALQEPLLQESVGMSLGYLSNLPETCIAIHSMKRTWTKVGGKLMSISVACE